MPTHDPGASPPLAALARAAASLLDQSATVIETLDSRDLTQESRVLSGGTIGSHLRHLLDHFNAILLARANGGEVDYDHRERGLAMERDPIVALREIRRVRDALAECAAGGGDQPLCIRMMLDVNGHEAALASTLCREIAFATHHGVHHLAMIRAIAIEHGRTIDVHVGRAPSTLHHERSAPR